VETHGLICTDKTLIALEFINAGRSRAGKISLASGVL
jgi:hypothetical protein